MSGVRTQLNAVVAASMSLVLLAFLVPLGLLLRRTAEERAVAAATQQAQAAAALVSLGQTAVPPDGGGGLVVSVFYPGGRVEGAPASRTASIELATLGRAFTADVGDGIEVLVPVQGLPDGTAVVRAYAPEPVLHQGVPQTLIVLAMLGLVLFGLGMVLADRLGRRLVGSVTALAAVADRLGTGDLTARVELSPTPELRRVGSELNHLAGRIQELLMAEREDVADLAHRLRTPVTALRLDIDSVRDPTDRQRLGADIDALSRLIDEVIRTARRPVREGVRPSADLVQVTADRVAFWSVLADDAGRPVRCVLPAGPILVRASPEDLVVALDALLENVFSHTPDDATLRVEVTGGDGDEGDGVGRDGDGGVVTVEDAGPGFASTVAARGVSAGGSTGLGLDIARRTAAAAGGSMRIGTSSLGGALVRLHLGPPA